MADFSGQLLTAPSQTSGASSVTGSSLTTPAFLLGVQYGPGGRIGLMQIGSIVTVHYKLTALCTTDGLRHYWTDTAISLTFAPPCVGGYVAGSLAVLGSWQTLS